MASTTFSVEDATTTLKEDGFLCIQDPSIGHLIAQMDLNESQFSPSSEAGMEFYRLHILGDTVGRADLSFF